MSDVFDCLSNAKPRTHKFKQIVWLDGEVFMKVIDVSNKTGMAVNVVIAEIVRKYLNGNGEPVKVIEKQIPMPAGFYCPLCLKPFKARHEVLEHFKYSSDCNQKLKELLR